MTDAGINIIRHFHNLSSNNELSRIDAQNLALNTLKSSKYGKHGYFWVNNTDGILLMHPYTHDLVNKNILDMVDKKGNYMFRRFIETAQNGGGIVEYYWPKPSTTKTFPKQSYVVYFEPWGWVLGTGLYLDDMERDIQNYAISALGVVFTFTILLIFFSISWTKRIMRQLENMAIRDPLTSLYTRCFLNHQMDNLILRHERDKAKYLSIVFFDIDFFKMVNDTYGHSYGDEVISKIGEIIGNTSRPDDLCIRYGGEEFVVILLSEDEATATRYAERVRSKVNKIKFNKGKDNFSVTISAGIATRNNDEEFDSILQRADDKLYEAKKQGRNCVVF